MRAEILAAVVLLAAGAHAVADDPKPDSATYVDRGDAMLDKREYDKAIVAVELRAGGTVYSIGIRIVRCVYGQGSDGAAFFYHYDTKCAAAFFEAEVEPVPVQLVDGEGKAAGGNRGSCGHYGCKTGE